MAVFGLDVARGDLSSEEWAVLALVRPRPALVWASSGLVWLLVGDYGCVTEVPAAVSRMIDATNAGDSDAFVDSFTDDAYLEDWGRGFHGHEGVRSWDGSDNIGRRAHFEAVGSRRDQEDWIVTLRVTGGGFNGTSDIRFSLNGDGSRG
jgi:hypothetical protein